MRVAVVLNDFPRISERFIYLQVAYLLRAGWSVSLICMGKHQTGHSREILSGLGLEQIKVYSDSTVKGKSRVSRVEATRRMLCWFFRKPYASFSVLRTLLIGRGVKGTLEFFSDAYFISRLPTFDIVHCQFLTTAHRWALVKASFSFCSKQKLCASVRGYDITKHTHLNKYDFAVLKKQIDLFLPVCKYLESQLVSFVEGAETEIVPSPVEVSKYKLDHDCEKSEESLRIISVGRLTEKKGYDTAIKSLRYLEIPFQYEIIGEGEERHDLETLRSLYDLDGDISLPGAQSHSRVIEAISQSHVLLVPSRTASGGDSEGIPNVIKEAMLLGVIVVASNHAGISEIVAEANTGFLFKEQDEISLTEALMRAVRNRDQWLQIASNAKAEVVSGYSPQRATEKLILAYKRAMND